MFKKVSTAYTLAQCWSEVHLVVPCRVMHLKHEDFNLATTCLIQHSNVSAEEIT